MDASLPPIFILRHGETEWNREGRMQGHLDSPLTDLGRAQAAHQGEILRRILPDGAVAVTSDSGRSVETARIALDGLGLPLSQDARLREIGLGDWQGLTLREIEARWGWLMAERDPLDWKFDAPGGEDRAALEARVAAFLRGLRGPAVIVTHGLTSRMLRCLALGLPTQDLGAVPGGQGVVHAIAAGRARLLRA
jgi:probable phosphoglycerate mutase